MVSKYEVSESVLLLSSPPPLRKLPDDYRTATGLAPLLLPATRLTIQEAWEFVEDATHLLFPEEAPTRSLARLPVATLADDPVQMAASERVRLGVPFATQLTWAPKDAFERWRSTLNDAGIIVLLKNMEWNDCRGCLLWNPDLIPAIVATSQDRRSARIFTTFHEYAHLLLRQPAACIQTEAVEDDRIASETWCNSFATHFLMPEDEIREVVARKLRRKNISDWTLGDFRSLAGTFRVSTMAVARRMKELYGSSFYDENFILLKGGDRERFDEDSEGGPLPYVVKLSEVGANLARQIAVAVRAQSLSRMEAADLLGLSGGQLAALQTRLAV